MTLSDRPFGEAQLGNAVDMRLLETPRVLVVQKGFDKKFHAHEEMLLIHEDLLNDKGVNLVLASLQIRLFVVQITSTINCDAVYHLYQKAWETKIEVVEQHPNFVELLCNLKPEKASTIRRAGIMRRDVLEVFYES
jgi:hypothetical protein